MLRISVIIGVLIVISHVYPALPASSIITTESSTVFFSDNASANSRSTFWASVHDYFLANAYGAMQTMHHQNLELRSDPWPTSIASTNQSKSINATKTPPIKNESPAGFVFDTNSVRHSTRPALRIRIGEKISEQALRRRFAGYTLLYATGEGCLVCAVITGADGQFDVHFEQDGQTVTQLRSTDSRVRDGLGNDVSTPLRNALGANTANCDAGETTTCASAALRGLSYIVTEDDRCSVTAEDQRPTDIPACARIGGFQILLNDR